MRNIWNDDEPELLPFTATCPGSGELVRCGNSDPHSGVVSKDLASCVLRGRRMGGGAVILCAVMVFKGLFLCTERP